MSVLDTFVNEMLQSEVPKRVLIERLLHGLEVEKLPQFKIPAPQFTFETQLHGLVYNYQQQTVTIAYKAVPAAYEKATVSFATFKALLEGIAVCIRMQKW